MVPIYDTDIAEERFEQDRWRNYELADRVEARDRRRRKLWIGFAVVVFVALSALPPILDRRPKWQSVGAARALSQRIDQLKVQAVRERHPMRLQLVAGKDLKLRISQVKECTDLAHTPVVEETLDYTSSQALQWITSEEIARLQIPGLVTDVCFDPLKGFFVGRSVHSVEHKLSGMGILPAEDLADARVDRVSIVFFDGESGSMSFE